MDSCTILRALFSVRLITQPLLQLRPPSLDLLVLARHDVSYKEFGTDHGYLPQRLRRPTIASLKSRAGHRRTVGSENSGVTLNAGVSAQSIIFKW
ncbi:MAG: hypothetical protein ACMG51_01500 [Ginsengibacter sp.]